jgi:hypothetical protein
MVRGYAPKPRAVSPVSKRRASRDMRRWLQSTVGEDTIQLTLIAHFNMRRKPGVLFFHIPNGGLRNLLEAKKLKAMGVVAGMPDMGFLSAGVTHYLELKTINGVLSAEQERMIAALRAAGAPAEVAFGLDAGVAQLERWGLIR